MSLNSISFPARALLAITALVSLGVVATEPAQIPLTSRVAEPPPPNVMVTLDDSGSMLADFMPEGNFTVNGVTVNLSAAPNGLGYVGSVYNDKRKRDQGVYGGVVMALPTGETAYQRQYRSPDVNKIYYNPDIRYQPWMGPSGTRLGNSTPTAALLDPTSTAANGYPVYDLTKNSQEMAVWCTAYNTCARYYEWRLVGKRWVQVEVARDFNPGLVYRLNEGASPAELSSYVKFDINDSNNYAPATKHANRTDCAGVKCTQQEERQNFANWFTYYRMRETLTKAAVSESLNLYVDKLRVGWARLNLTDTQARDKGKAVSRIETDERGGPIRLFTVARRNTVLGAIQGHPFKGGTPLRVAVDEVGKYFQRSSSEQLGSPWLEDPTDINSAKLTCRRSANLLLTDGYYNDAYTDAGDLDSTEPSDDYDYSGDEKNPNKYSPTKYMPVRPFIDEPDRLSNTLADAAMKYFYQDLEPDIDNKVWTVDGDIAYWQHLTQYTVGLGVKGTLDSSTPAKKVETLQKIRDGELQWPKPEDKNPPTKIDDMWHAAVNTGGNFYSVSNVTELTEAFVDAFGRAAGNEAKEAGVATSAPFTTADNVKYVPKYKSVSWYGDLEAYELAEDGDQETLKWSASEKMPAATDRRLYTWDGASSTAKEFTWSTMGAANQSQVGSESLTNFIRGDDSQEGEAKAFRDRNDKVLGDFVNSPPVLVGKYLDQGYATIDSSYATHLANKKNRPELVVLGGNAGVVHFFRASDGTEVFGFLPQTGLSNLDLIARKDYGTNDNFHRFFIDGPMMEADAKIGGEWTNLVLGAMGAGGKSLFALRIPTTYGSDGMTSADFGASTVLWEKSGDSDADIGHMFADFAVGKIKGSNDYVAFVGNGVYSSSGKAVLLIVNLADGSILKKLTVDNASGNGLMGVSVIRDVETKEVVGAYAGDLKGNLWRFDFKGGSESQWTVGFGGAPLFAATGPQGARQAITAPPVFVDHSETGRVVLFGTGQLVDETDSDTTATQTFYGAWDPTAIGAWSAGSSPFAGGAADRDLLQEQVIDPDPVTGVGIDGTYFEVRSTPVDWQTKKGWFIDLPFSRQRVIYPSLVLADKFIYFSTLVPAAPAAQCDVSTGEGYNFLLQAVDGGVVPEAVFDTDGDGDIDGDDVVVQGVKTDADGRDAVIIKGDEGDKDPDCVDGWRTYYRTDTSGQSQMMRVPCSVPTTGPKDRVWKQIVNPPTGG
jgi:type IV pilus assembly protein PilY1